jgi:glucose/arabinose dehydrogenase
MFWFKYMKKLFLLIAFLSFGCHDVAHKSASSPNLSFVKLPKGFYISSFADDVKGARSLVLSPNGTLFVGTRDAGNVYALVDTNKDGKADKKYMIAHDLNMPNGVAFRDGALYVAEVSKIWRYDNIEAQLDHPPKPVLIRGDFPTETHHGWKFIRFGPDGKLYVPVGAPCNICESEDERFASIMRMNPDGSDLEVFARGIRNSVGFDWHPVSKELWFTDNGRDMLGDDTPSCELNRAPQKDLHFGYPYCHSGDIADPEFGKKHSCSEFVPPAQKLGAHVAPLGLRFYTGAMFPAEYKNQIFVAKHGSWNRSKKSGYVVSLVKLDANGKAISDTPFASGWLNEASQEVSGRPVDVLVMPDGALLVSDDEANRIYRIGYDG